MTACLLVVCEVAADFRIASELVDRVLCERVEWLEPTLLPSVRQWWEYDSEHPFLLWHSLKATVQRLGLQRLRPRSRFNGELGAPDAAAADIALQFAAWIQKSADVAAVLLIRDTDKDEERRRGLEQARILDGHSWPFSIVLGVAHPKRERGSSQASRRKTLSRPPGSSFGKRDWDMTPARIPSSSLRVRRVQAPIRSAYTAMPNACFTT